MCGINCLVHVSSDRLATPPPRAEVLSQIQKGTSAIAHRGPDGQGAWVSDDGKVGAFLSGCTSLSKTVLTLYLHLFVFFSSSGLGHCRLAIIGDERGLQPLADTTGKPQKVHAIVNGEFYDHEEIRRTLCKGYEFSSDSDSEILIALYLRYGLPEALKHLRGEFAFVLYDEPKGRLFAVRDRFGVKPLYFGFTPEGQLALASEIKGLLAMGVEAKWDLFRAVNEGWRVDNGTLLQNIKWLKVGWMLEVSFLSKDIQQRCWYIPNFPLKVSL